MTWLNGFIRKQGQLLLDNNRYAMLHAIALALLPFTAWLSVVIIAFVTLRKGLRDGGWLLVAVTMVTFALSLLSSTAGISLVDALLTFVPCYLAACMLRLTTSWRAVARIFFLQVVVIVLLLQMLMPDFIMAQYLYLESVLRAVQTENSLLEFINDKSVLNQSVIANYLLGLQAVGVVLSASFSLMFARSVQSQLFCPGGFKQEMLAFRADKIGLFLLLVLVIAASQQSGFAMNLLPILLFYFLLAGLSLSFTVLAKQKSRYTGVLLIATLFLLPFIMLPVYVIFGSLDSLFNFRLYLPADAGKTI
jgi:hypothetical protein